jgi:putative oxidoreductase
LLPNTATHVTFHRIANRTCIKPWLANQAAKTEEKHEMTIQSQDLISRGYQLYVKAADSLKSPFLLAVRLYWGWQLMQSGWGKLHNIPGVTEFFASLRLPAPHFTAIAISNLELFGGALLAFGLGSRVIALVLSGNMFMAYVTADREALMSVFSDPGKFYNADPFTFLMASLLVFIFGAGIFSADWVIQCIVMAQRSSVQHEQRTGVRMAVARSSGA